MRIASSRRRFRDIIGAGGEGAAGGGACVPNASEVGGRLASDRGADVDDDEAEKDEEEEEKEEDVEEADGTTLIALDVVIVVDFNLESTIGKTMGIRL